MYLVKHKKHRRTVKQKRTVKPRRSVKQKRSKKYRRSGGDGYGEEADDDENENKQYTAAERTAIIQEFKKIQEELQYAATNNVDVLDKIVLLYTHIVNNAGLFLKIEKFREVLLDKITDIESKESVWLDPKYRNEFNVNLNVLKSKYFQRKSKLLELLEKYDKLY